MSSVAAKRAYDRVDSIYPPIDTGKPHYRTRFKQRIAWQLGYIRGYEDARREIITKHLEAFDEHAEARK